MKFSVENGSFSYKKGKKILDNISFSIEKGEILGILGRNGAGKTTLLRCITGSLKWSTGKCLIDGADISKMPPKDLWKKIAYVPQAKSSPFSYTAEEAVLMGRASHFRFTGKPSHDDVVICRDALNSLGILHLKNKPCNQISGGELQMVLIARALASEAEIIILDEPESNLDFKNQLTVLDTMTKLSEKGITCIFNTHYPSHALQRASSALLLTGDGKWHFGKAEDIITEQNISDAFGVRAVIGDMETEQTSFKNIMPVSVPQYSDKGKMLAVISVAVKKSSSAEKVNNLLYKHRDNIMGRMGLPCANYGVNIINVTLEAEKSEIDTLTSALSKTEGISVKTIYIGK